MKKGLFITFEGIDGSGKTTQYNLLGGRLRRCGLDVVCVREPGSTAVGEEIRSILLSRDDRPMTLLTEALLYAAARSQLVREVIAPALESGKVVLCDRFLDSSLAYQGHAGGLGVDTVMAVNAAAVQGVRPHLTLVFDLSVSEALRRERGRKADRIESRGVEYLQRVREYYLELAREEPDRVRVIPAARDIAEIAADVYRVVREGLAALGLDGRG